MMVALLSEKSTVVYKSDGCEDYQSEIHVQKIKKVKVNLVVPVNNEYLFLIYMTIVLSRNILL